MDSSVISIDDLRTYHQVDRVMYRRLVIDLGHKLMQSMEMIGLWFWLEELGYPNLILKMETLPNEIVNIMAEEALTCLRCIVSETPPPPPLPPLSVNYKAELLMTLALMEDKHISLQFLYENRERAVPKILGTVNTLNCNGVFYDIMQEALLRNPAAHLNLLDNIIRDDNTFRDQEAMMKAPSNNNKHKYYNIPN